MRFHIGKTVIRIHPLLIFLILLSFFMNSRITLCASLCALLIHESGHLLFTYLFHVPVHEIEIGLFGGIMECDLRSASLIQQIFISLSGPLFSLLGYVLSYACLTGARSQVVFFLDLLRMNLLLFLVNLLPVLPLDGGQIVLKIFRNSSLCRKILAGAGFATGILLIALSVVFALDRHLILAPAFAGCFLVYAASRDRRTAAGQCMHQIIAQNYKLNMHKAVPVRFYNVRGDMSLLQLVPQLPQNCSVHLFICDPNNGKKAGEMTHEQICQALLHDPHQTLMDALTMKQSRS